MAESNTELRELSSELLHKYIDSANQSVKKMEDERYTNRKDTKAFRRKMFADYAKSKINKEELSELSLSTYHNYIRKAKHVVDHTPEDSKVHKKAKDGIARAERLSDRKAIKEETDRIIRHSVHKKAYVKPDVSATGEPNFRASNKHGNLKFFNNKKSALRHAGIEESALSFGEFIDLQERQLLSPAYYATVHRRDTKLPGVRHRKNAKMKGMYDWNRTQYVTRQLYKQRSAHDPAHLTTRSKHQLTDRWRDQYRVRIKLLKKNKNVHTNPSYAHTHMKESNLYLKNRQLIHDAHAQAGREIGKRERDPELKRIHLHRSRKHSHASKVLEVIRNLKKKK